MRHTDIAIVGGGIAGSMAAAMLGRAGWDVVLIDPHSVYPPDFRCEKLDPGKMEAFEKTGLAEQALRVATTDGGIWIARRGRVLERRPNRQYGFYYETLVNAVRSLIPGRIESVAAKATANMPHNTPLWCRPDNWVLCPGLMPKMAPANGSNTKSCEL